MKAALIPPKGYYRTAFRSNIHLMLAQIDSRAYELTYESLRTGSDYIIMDNGAAEGHMVTDEVLLFRAAQFQVNEVVIPDVLGDAFYTCQRVHDFMKQFGPVVPSAVSLMAVVQGNKLNDIQYCIREYMKHDQIKVLGIPRHLVDKDLWMRHYVCQWINNQGLAERFKVHLLGTNARWPNEIQHLNDMHSWIRSVDTSLPYNYTIANRRLESTVTTPIMRPIGYFEKTWELSEELLFHNIRTYLGWANGSQGARS